MDQTYGSEERVRVLGTAAMAAAPTPATVPHFAMSARTRNGLPSTGFIASFFDPGSGGPTVGGTGITVRVWRWFPSVQQWGSLVALSSVALGEVMTCNDLDPAHVYLQITAGITVDGTVLVAFQET